MYQGEYESDTRRHFPSPVVVIDDIGEEVELDTASAEADALRGDLEMLFDVTPGTYLRETYLVFEGGGGGPSAGRRATPRQAVATRLSEVRARFESAGGRGVDGAEEIDRLTVALGLADGDQGVADAAREALFGPEGVLARPNEVSEAAYRSLYELAECAFDSAASDASDPIAAVLADLANAAETVAALRRAIEERFPVEVVDGEIGD